MNSIVTEEATNSSNRSLYRHYVLFLLLLVGICSWSDRQVFSIVLEGIRKEFVLSDTQLGLLGGTAFALFYVAVGIPIARLADKLSRRNIIASAVFLWSLMTALTAAAGGYGTLFACRVGLGIGEAGGSAPSQAMIADLYPPRQRALAMGVLFSNIPIGYLLSYALGGWLNDEVGWRAAFIAFGVPGVVLAALFRFTTREPRRGAFEVAASLRPNEESLARTVVSLLRLKAIRHICFGGAAHGFGMYAVAVWLPSFFMRVHGVNSTMVGLRLALIMGVGGLVGTLTGGRVADGVVARTRSPGWYLWTCALALTISVPLTISVYAVHGVDAAFLLLIVPMILNNSVIGPITASIQALAGARQRAVAAAIYLTFSNLVAAGFGPLLTGAISDALHTRYPADSLRYALLLVVPASAVWAGMHFYFAGKAMRSEIPTNVPNVAISACEASS